MTEYIERAQAIKAVCDSIPHSCSLDDCQKECQEVSAIVSAPAADVRPVVRATWRRYSPFTDTYECSNCGEQVIDQQFRTNFCPNCGAMMEES